MVLGPGGEASSLIKSEVERGSISPFETKGSKLTFATYPIVNNAPVRIGLNGVPAESRLPPPPNPIDRVTIDSSGKVGIGTAAPLTVLDVRGEASFQGAVFLNQAGAAAFKTDPRAGLTFGAADFQAVFFPGLTLSLSRQLRRWVYIRINWAFICSIGHRTAT